MVSKKTWIISVVAGIIVTGGGIAAYSLLNQPPESKSSGSGTESDIPPDPMTITTLPLIARNASGIALIAKSPGKPDKYFRALGANYYNLPR